MFNQPENRCLAFALSFSVTACHGFDVAVFAVWADDFEDVGYVFGVAGLGWRVRSALVDKRLLDRVRVLQAAFWTAEDSGGVGG